jgi:hypothetical protein
MKQIYQKCDKNKDTVNTQFPFEKNKIIKDVLKYIYICLRIMNTSEVPNHNPTRKSVQCQEEFTDMYIKTRLNSVGIACT